MTKEEIQKIISDKLSETFIDSDNINITSHVNDAAASIYQKHREEMKGFAEFLKGFYYDRERGYWSDVEGRGAYTTDQLLDQYTNQGGK